MTEREIRIEAAKILTPGPWKHIAATSVEPGWGVKWWAYCRKCNGSLDGACPRPDPLTESMPEIAERLLRKVMEQGDLTSMGGGYILLTNTIERLHEQNDADEQFSWWLASPIQRAEICIKALEAAKEEDTR